MNEETKTEIRCFCKKCERDLPIARMKSRTLPNGKVYIDNVCWSCNSKREMASLRLQMFKYLGDCCACCGEKHPNFLTLEHINGDSSTHYYGRKENVPAHRKQSNTYVELRKARKSGWDKTQYEVLCMNCNFAKGHFGQCPHRTGVTIEEVLASLQATTKGIGYERSIKAMIEGGNATRYQEGQERPEMLGNKHFPKNRDSNGQFVSEKVN